MPHFFIKSQDVKDNVIKISDKDNFNHITKSLRIKQGEKILLIDEKQIQYECFVENIGKDFLNVQIQKFYPSKRFLNINISLAQSPLRSDKQNLLIEKATELGINNIYPILTDNCALKKSVIEQKIEKWQKIMTESSKQCERAFIPKCHELTTIENLTDNKKNLNKFDRILAFTERDAQIHIKEYLKSNPIKQGENILVIIGPEGGFSLREFEYFQKNEKIITLSLGDLILRAETAVIVALGALVV